jgi:hypothetical protein
VLSQSTIPGSWESVAWLALYVKIERQTQEDKGLCEQLRNIVTVARPNLKREKAQENIN